MSIWEVLGIAPTTDKAAIRHAYAQKTRTCHPEEDPEGFDVLHKAFTAAMRAARQGVSVAVMEQESPAAPAAPAASLRRSAEACHAAAKAARAARRAAEQQAVEQYASRAQRRAGKIIQLGQGEQEEGQQFDFAAVDAAPAQTAPEPKAEPDRPLTHEERAWCNSPAPAPEPKRQEQPKREAKQPPEYQPMETASGPRSGRGWRVASLLLTAGILIQLVRGGYVSTTLLLIALCWCGMQGARVDWTRTRLGRRITGLWAVSVVLLPVLWFFVMAITWGLHGATDAALDYAVGAIFLSILAAPFGLCSTLLARQRANRR